MRPILLLPLLLAACAAAAPRTPDTLLAIGDSVMAWNGAAGIPEATGRALGRPVVDRAQSLARVSNPNPVAAALGFDIARQFRGGTWDWVIATGGGNDIRDACKTPAEERALDTLIAEDLSGEVPTLISRIRSAGARVAYVGYYDGAAFGETGFTPCQNAFDRMNRRLARLAAQDPGVVFLDAGSVIDPESRDHYAPDRVHPSPKASAIIGRALAQAIRRAEAAD